MYRVKPHIEPQERRMDFRKAARMDPEEAARLRQIIGRRLKQARVAKRMSQEIFSNLTGADTTTVSRWENGHTTPLLHYQSLLCQALGVPYEILFRELVNLPPVAEEA